MVLKPELKIDFESLIRLAYLVDADFSLQKDYVSLWKVFATFHR